MDDLKQKLADMEFSYIYEMKTLNFLLDEKDKNTVMLNEIVDAGFREMRMALDELKSGVNQILVAIQQIAVSVSELVDSINFQRQSVKRLLEHNEKVSESSRLSKDEQQNLSGEILLLQKNSSVIIEMINNIDDIAERLGILSINGAIQAARSGEFGKGFAVVTTEMRKLSESVIENTANQKKTAEGIISLINQSGKSQRVVSERTDDVLAAVESVALNVEEINSQIDRVAENSEELSATVQEFSATIEQISRNVDSIHGMMDSIFQNYIKEMNLSNIISDTSRKMKEISAGETSMETASMKHMKYIYDRMTDVEGNRYLAMCRVFVALPFDELPSSYRENINNEPGYESSRYLCLVGTAGEDKLWNRIEDSEGHKIIRLPESKRELSAMPMLDKVFSSLGMDYSKIVNPSKMDAGNLIEGYYLEEDAPGSPYIPDKKFLRDFGIKSQLSIGGVLPSGIVFTCFLFFKEDVKVRDAETIKILAQVMQLCYKPFDQVGQYWNKR